MTMAPEAMFLLGLLLKIAMTASIVVAASVVVERSGPFVGSLIASLPTAGGAAMIILAWEHPPAFIAQSAVGSMVSNAVCGGVRADVCRAGATALAGAKSGRRLPGVVLLRGGLAAGRLERRQRRRAQCRRLSGDDPGGRRASASRVR